MKISEQERASGQLSAVHHKAAVEQVDMNGYVIFEDLLPDDFMDTLYHEFMGVFEPHIATHGANRGVNRHQMHLPFRPPFSDERLIANPLVLQVVDALLGPDYICHYLASDTPLPGSDYQNTHADIHPLFPEHPTALPAYSIVINVPLVDVTEDNGPLQIWPGGTHRHTYPATQDMIEVADSMHSERVLMKRGSVLIRDSRMWHRGTPNRSGSPRPNYALIYSRHWLRLKYPQIDIPRATYDALSERAQHLFRLENIIEETLS